MRQTAVQGWPRKDEAGRELNADEDTRLRLFLEAQEARNREDTAARHDARYRAALPGEHHADVDHVKPENFVALNTCMRRSELLRALVHHSLDSPHDHG
ncbi:hypothetical protein [Paraburkholderia bannensis]|uniref:hypothetical protein n=1 Tax=Paraburkholderia bannensis TaxID=765414 RepID=UPI002AB6A392|nr:hypothetical protein [Paraburkholderia bannensis]